LAVGGRKLVLETGKNRPHKPTAPPGKSSPATANPKVLATVVAPKEAQRQASNSSCRHLQLLEKKYEAAAKNFPRYFKRDEAARRE